MKITLIGQLGSVADKGTCMVGVMEHTGEKFPTLPKDVPAPQAIPTTYVVSIAPKQWKQVATVATDPEDTFIIEGFPQLDAATGSLAVFAISITSKKLQAAKNNRASRGELGVMSTCTPHRELPPGLLCHETIHASEQIIDLPSPTSGADYGPPPGSRHNTRLIAQ